MGFGGWISGLGPRAPGFRFRVSGFEIQARGFPALLQPGSRATSKLTIVVFQHTFVQFGERKRPHAPTDVKRIWQI